MPNGLLEPVWWRKRRCKTAIAKIINGTKKWKAKKRLRVALSTAKPPQIHSTSDFPI